MSLWTFVPGCECERCTAHHDRTCPALAATREAHLRAQTLEGDAYVAAMDALTRDPPCGCPEADGVLASHTEWGHPAAPVRGHEVSFVAGDA